MLHRANCEMANANLNPLPTSESWNMYWEGTSTNNALNSGGANHPLLDKFWESHFNSLKSKYKKPAILDIASGNGAIVEHAMNTFERNQCSISCLDVSEVAINNISLRFPDIKGIVADASDIPSHIGRFEIVTSQFGVEYAGTKAIFEAANVVADNGQLVILSHIESGSIYRQCSHALSAINRLRNSHFIALAKEMFSSGFKAMETGEQTSYETAIHNFKPAVLEIQAIINEFGPKVASETVVRLYNDVKHIHSRMKYYSSEDVIDWLIGLDREIDGYAKRMSSMTHASLNSLKFKELVTGLKKLNFSIERAETLLPLNEDLPIAWLLIATKTSHENSK